MMDRELLAERVLGWQKRHSPNPAIYAWERPDGERVTRFDVLQGFTDAEFVEMIEVEIERRGLQEAYVVALGEIVTTMGDIVDEMVRLHRENDALLFWRILRSTPKQRGQAALEVVKG